MLQFNFVSDAEQWVSYDFELDDNPPPDSGLPRHNGGQVQLTHSRTGGVDDGPYISSDESKWSIDTPERPPSILPLMTSGNAIPSGTDLRYAEVSVYLRGDKLDLYGGECLFWIKGRKGYRWHMSGKPLKITNNDWGTRLTFILENDEKLWHVSWPRLGTHDDVLRRLDIALGDVENLGFSFVHFDREAGGRKGVTGTFSIAHLAIRQLQ
jgi:hypothetical protein